MLRNNKTELRLETVDKRASLVKSRDTRVEQQIPGPRRERERWRCHSGRRSKCLMGVMGHLSCEAAKCSAKADSS